MHIGLIIDGNRRWAQSRLLPKAFGHKKGVENLEKILKICARRQEIDFVSVFTLSTENMQREATELKNLFSLIEKFAAKWEEFVADGICVRILGDIGAFPASCQKALRQLEKKTASCGNLVFCPALNYGGRAEIIQAVNALPKTGAVSEADFEKVLSSGWLPDIDLLIRTGGKKRFSNFMLWRAAYAELCFLDKLWPDFTEQDLDAVLDFYAVQQRNFGK